MSTKQSSAVAASGAGEAAAIRGCECGIDAGQGIGANEMNTRLGIFELRCVFIVVLVFALSFLGDVQFCVVGKGECSKQCASNSRAVRQRQFAEFCFVCFIFHHCILHTDHGELQTQCLARRKTREHAPGEYRLVDK